MATYTVKINEGTILGKMCLKFLKEFAQNPDVEIEDEREDVVLGELMDKEDLSKVVDKKEFRAKIMKWK